MRVSITNRPHISEKDLRATVELAPSLALPWLIRLRSVLLGGAAVLLLVAEVAGHLQLPIVSLSVLLVTVIASNLAFRRISGVYGARHVIGAVLVGDTVALTAGLALSGGPHNPFSLLYLVQITLSAVLLSKPWTWWLGGLSILGFGLLFFIHVPVPLLEGHHPGGSFSVHLIGMWIAFVVAALLITILVGKISEILRDHEDELLRLQNLLNRREKIASLATLAAGAAHEMGTPLATIAVVSRELENYAVDRGPDPHVASEARLIRSEVDRCGRFLRQMSAQGAGLAGEAPEQIPLEELLIQLRDSFPEAQRTVIEIDTNSGLCATLPIESTRQVLSALLKNALEASPAGTAVKLSAQLFEGGLRFIVKDSGTGMPPEVLNRIGEPFYTTKRAERGMGLGTFLVRTFAEDMGGALAIDSVLNQGTTAILELPLDARNGQ